MAIQRGFGRLGMWSAGSSPLGITMAEFDSSLSEANTKWAEFTDRTSRGLSAEIAPLSSAVDLANTILSNLDFSSQDAFIESMSSLLGIVGPIGGWAGEAIKWMNDAAKWITKEAPAFTIQLQDYNYAYLNRWLSENVLGLRGVDPERTLNLFYGTGWMPIYAIGGAFGVNSGSVVGDWGGDGGGVEADVEKFALVAGPRSTPSVREDIRTLADSDWAKSAEGRASIAAGRRLAESLAPTGYRTVNVQRELSGTHVAYVGNGLSFFHNIEYDLNPGVGTYFVWLRGFMVNIAMLPDDILVPLTNYIYLTVLASQTLGGLTADAERKAKKAAFGPNGEAFKRWNLTWILYQVLRRTPVAIAAVAEEGKRFRKSAGMTVRLPSKKTAAQLSESSSVVPVAAGLGLAALAAWLLLS